MTRIDYNMNAGPEDGGATLTNLGMTGGTLNAVGGTAIYKAAAALFGAFGVRLTNSSGQLAIVRPPAWTANAQFSFAGGFRTPAAWPASDISIASFRHASGSNCSLRIEATTGKLAYYRTNATFQAYYNGGAALSLSTYYRFTAVLNATTGAFTFKLYNAAGTLIGSALTGTAAMQTTNPFTTFEMGQSNTAIVSTVDIDHMQGDDGSSTELPPPSNTPPTATIIGTQSVATGVTVHLTATPADSDGTIASRAWTCIYSSTGSNPTLTNANTDDATFTAGPVGTLYVFQYIATDDGSATSTPATTEVRVPSPSDVGILPATTGGAAWTNVGGAASESAALNDTDDNTYIESPDATSTPSVHLFGRFAPVTPRSSYKFPILRLSQSVSGTLIAKIRLKQGATVIQEWTVPTTTTPTHTQISGSDVTVGSVEKANITDPGNLYLEGVAST